MIRNKVKLPRLRGFRNENKMKWDSESFWTIWEKTVSVPKLEVSLVFHKFWHGTGWFNPKDVPFFPFEKNTAVCPFEMSFNLVVTLRKVDLEHLGKTRKTGFVLYSSFTDIWLM